MKKHSTIYIIGLIISVILIGLYFINTSNAFCILSCSIGASLIGAVALAFFLELSDKNKKKEDISTFRKEKLTQIKSYLTRVTEITIRKFYNLNSDKLEKDKVYAVKYNDIKDILINEYTNFEISSYEQGVYNQQIIDFYNDGFSILDTIVSMVNKIISQEDLLVINKIFTKEEIEILRTTTVTLPVVDKNSLELTIYNVTFIIDQLLNIPEISILKDYYGVYSVNDHRMAICDNNKQPVIRPLNIIFKLDESIRNGEELIKTKENNNG